MSNQNLNLEITAPLLVKESEQQVIYKEELSAIQAFTTQKYYKPRMSIDIWLVEADGYKEQLTQKFDYFVEQGMPKYILKNLHRRIACARISQALLSTYLEEERVGKATFNELFPEAKELRKKILSRVRYVVKNEPQRYSIIKKITSGRRVADTIQDLVELAVLAEGMMPQLQKLTITPDEVYRAKELSAILGGLSEASRSSKKQNSEARGIRDKSITLLQQTIIELQDFVAMLYTHKDPQRSPFFSSYQRRKNNASRPIAVESEEEAVSEEELKATKVV